MPPYTRRLSDKVLIAFHMACDLDDYEVAEELLKTLEYLFARTVVGDRRRQEMETLVAAHERLWYLRRPDLGTHNEGRPFGAASGYAAPEEKASRLQ